VLALLFVAVDVALVVSSRTAEPGLFSLAPTPAAIVLRPTAGEGSVTPIVFLMGNAIPARIMEPRPGESLYDRMLTGHEPAFLPVDDHSMRVVAEVIGRAVGKDSAKYDAGDVPSSVPPTWVVSYIAKATIESAPVTREIHVSTARLRASAAQWRDGLHSDLDNPLRSTLSSLVSIGEGNPHYPPPYPVPGR
jgi:hypothetical protein